jgi:glycogen synthase
VKIVLAPSAYYPNIGGIEELTRQLARELTSRGHSVSVVTNRWPDELYADEWLDGVQVKRLMFPLPRAEMRGAAAFLATGPIAATHLVRSIRACRPDVVHVIGAGPQSAYLGVLKGVCGSSLVFTAAGELTFDATAIFRRSVSLRVGLRRMLRSADAITACSEYVMRDLGQVTVTDAPKFVVPFGVNPDEFPHPEDRDRHGAPYVAAVGRLVPQKGFDVLVSAFETEALSHLRLVVAGDGFERLRLQQQTERLGLDGRVEFVGAIDRVGVAALLRFARIFAFPSRGEAFGIALLEAMAAGVPSVAAAAGGIPEFAVDGENALLVGPDKPEELATAIARLDADEELRSRLARGGLETARHLSWANLTTRYEEVYSHASAQATR